jgi:hypothetical protein
MLCGTSSFYVWHLQVFIRSIFIPPAMLKPHPPMSIIIISQIFVGTDTVDKSINAMPVEDTKLAEWNRETKGSTHASIEMTMVDVAMIRRYSLISGVKSSRNFRWSKLW